MRSFILLILLSTTLIPPLAKANDIVRLTNGEWPPFLSKTLNDYGFASLIVKRAFELEGIAVEYGFFPWKRAYNYAKAGSWDGSVLWSKTSERVDDFYFSDAVVESRDVFFHHTDTQFTWSQVKDLAEYKIATTRGYFYGDLFHDAANEKVFKMEEGESDLTNLKKLFHKRVDLFVVNLYVGNDLLMQQFTPFQREYIRFHPKSINQVNLHLILSKAIPKNDLRMTQFNRGLLKLKKSGELDSIISTYLKNL